MTKTNNAGIKELQKNWQLKRPAIEKRLKDFSAVWDKSDNHGMFCELAFCLFTPQSKAKSCWAAIEHLKEVNYIKNAPIEKIAKVISAKGVRFKNNKAKYLVEARAKLLKDDIKKLVSSFKTQGEARDWLAKNIKGMGLKEAGHFLRNVGRGSDIAILDRHILKNLKLLGAINEIPKTLSPAKYYEIENQMKEFCKKTKIPLDHMDLLMWQNETGEIFK